MVNMKNALLSRIAMDFSVDYNASIISKVLKVSRVGAFKALKSLEKGGIVRGKSLGKAVFYHVNLQDKFVFKNVEIALMEESRQHARWVNEFEDMYQYCDMVLIFGSVLKNESKANDIDLLIVLDQKNNENINRIIKEKNLLLPKRIHPVKQSLKDLVSNLKKKDKVIISALREGVVLHGHDILLEAICRTQQTK